MRIIEHLSKRLFWPEKSVYNYILTCPYRYKVYEIPKRNGKGSRVIAQPSKELKYIQKVLLEEKLIGLPIHKSTTAYRKGLGIKDNVRAHKNCRFLLKMDFSNFFPSILPKDLIDHIQKHFNITLSENDRIALARIFFFYSEENQKLVLSIGAPSSPFISNTIMYDFDCILSDYCSSNSINYTRYADDLAFSTNEKNILFKVPDFIKGVAKKIIYPDVYINKAKTVFTSKRDNRHITGLVITNDKKISIGRNKKRYIKSLVYKFINGQLERNEVKKLKGLISFILDVEPSFYESLKKKYGADLIKGIRNSS